MLGEIIGIENVEFSIDEQNFKGQNLYFTYHNKNISGLGSAKVFSNNGNYKIGDKINVLYSRTFKKLYIKTE